MKLVTEIYYIIVALNLFFIIINGRINKNLFKSKSEIERKKAGQSSDQNFIGGIFLIIFVSLIPFLNIALLFNNVKIFLEEYKI